MKPYMIVLVLFIGCNMHPQAGDYYEDKSDGGRVNVIAVGGGKELLTRFNKEKKELETMSTEMMVFFIGDSSVSDGSTEYVLYELQRKQIFKKLFAMREVKYFDKDFRIIE